MNSTEFAILGLLAEEPRTGYDIKKEVEERLSHFWSQSFGHLYPMLKRLAGRGLVEMTVERQDDRPDRKVYAITAEGRDALAAWFAKPPSPQPPRNELLLRIFMGRYGDPAFLVRDVRARREEAAGRLRVLREVEAMLQQMDTEHPDRAFWEVTVRYGLHVLSAVEEWGREAEATLARLDDV